MLRRSCIEIMLKNEFIQEIREMLGDQLPAFLLALDESPALALRVNPLRPGASAAAAEFLGDPVPWAQYGYYLKEGLRPGASLAHQLGAFYMQEASAMVSASVMDAQPGEKILDLCAAPGGKTTQLAAAMRGEGILISNEPIPNRAKILAENLERLGVVNDVAVCAYPDHLAKKWPEFFDGVLVDAPCSGEGMFRREPASRGEWAPGSPTGCAKRQADILDSAAIMVRPGGRLVYSTCTFNRSENERTIEAFLSRHPEFSIESFSLPGIGESVNGCLRVWPHLVRGDGHFVAKLRKADREIAPEPRRARRKGSEGSRPKPVRAPRTVSEESPEQLLARLENEVCTIPEVLRDGKLIRQADYIHLLPKDAPSFDGIKTVKPGLCLMRVGRSHVQPMPALAMACCGADATPHPGYERCVGRAHRTIELTESEALAALNGEFPNFSAPPGRHLLTFHSLPLLYHKVAG